MTKQNLYVVAAVLLAAASLYFRSQSATEARTQADGIVRQDAAGADTGPAIASLKTYVQSHFGANVSFTLNGSYTRAQTAAKAAATASAANARIYADAQRACASKNDSVTQARCNQTYISKQLANLPAPTPVAEPKLADYQHHLQAPLWAPDLAGALLLGAAVALVMAAVSFIKRRR